MFFKQIGSVDLCTEFVTANQRYFLTATNDNEKNHESQYNFTIIVISRTNRVTEVKPHIPQLLRPPRWKYYDALSWSRIKKPELDWEAQTRYDVINGISFHYTNSIIRALFSVRRDVIRGTDGVGYECTKVHNTDSSKVKRRNSISPCRYSLTRVYKRMFAASNNHDEIQSGFYTLHMIFSLRFRSPVWNVFIFTAFPFFFFAQYWTDSGTLHGLTKTVPRRKRVDLFRTQNNQTRRRPSEIRKVTRAQWSETNLRATAAACHPRVTRYYYYYYHHHTIFLNVYGKRENKNAVYYYCCYCVVTVCRACTENVVCFKRNFSSFYLTPTAWSYCIQKVKQSKSYGQRLPYSAKFIEMYRKQQSNHLKPPQLTVNPAETRLKQS